MRIGRVKTGRICIGLYMSNFIRENISSLGFVNPVVDSDDETRGTFFCK